jgi:diguanylate cyclase (GGDEF)-like protein/PAS domain S-box-containing protein
MHAHFRAVFDISPIGIARMSADGRMLEPNAALELLLGRRADELAGVGLAELLHADDRDEVRAGFAALRAGTLASYDREHRCLDAEGEPVRCRVTVGAVEDEVLVTIQELDADRTTERLARIVDTQHDIVGEGLDLPAVTRLLVERTCELTAADGAIILLLEGEKLALKAASGVDEPHIQLAERLTPRVIAEATAVLVDEPGGSAVSVPLFRGRETVGTLTAFTNPGAAALTHLDRRTIELLGVMLSSAVDRAAELEALTRFETIYRDSPIGIGVLSLDGRLVDTNASMREITGFSAEELASMSVADYTHPDHVEEMVARYRGMLRGEHDSYRAETQIYDKQGGIVWTDHALSIVREPDGKPRFAVLMAQDITRRKEAEAELVRQAELNEHQALHDALTDLPNRTLFRERIEHAIRGAERDGRPLAVLMMDLDRFKEVNDSLGHGAGDTLLQVLAERLQGVLRTVDTVARLGGDEFGLLLHDATGEDIRPVVERILEVVQDPIVVNGLPLAIEASIGIAVYPDHGVDFDTLVQHADVAMYRAKQQTSGFAFFDEAVERHDPLRLTLVAELRRAISNRELELFYQPKASLATGDVTSVEALLRWHHPERGLVEPDEFIPLAQQTSLMGPLTLYVVDEALRQCAAWQRQGFRLSVAVNLSARNLLDLDFPEQVRCLLVKWKVDPALLRFEITESTMQADPARTKVVLERLSGMGLRLSIDDFGTGYSSLAYLKRLPVDEIKIDRSFVLNMETDAEDAAIVRSTIDLGRNLGLQVVAEGVETEAAWNRLESLGCTTAQGYFLTRPVAAPELLEWLRGYIGVDDAPGSAEAA